MNDFTGWVPVRVHWSGGEPRLDWCYLGGLCFNDPFFDQTVARAFRHPANVLFQHETPLAALGELNARSRGVSPAGFIFHMSRCGSTLISQMLAALPEHTVISEASPVDGILRAHFRDRQITEEQRIEWLRGLLNAYGQKPANQRDSFQGSKLGSGPVSSLAPSEVYHVPHGERAGVRSPISREVQGEQRLFIKFDCWHTLFLPLISRAFPEVPWIFVYRDPLEVLVSHQNQPGHQMVSGALEPALFGWADNEVARMSPGEYRARILAAICAAAFKHARTGNSRLINYSQLPSVMTDILLKFWGIENSPSVAGKLANVSQFDAKNPKLPFENDSATKQLAATNELRQVSRRWLDELYQQLETLRIGARKVE